MGKVKKEETKKTPVENTSSKEKKQVVQKEKKVTKTSTTKGKRVDKDTLMNTPKEKDSGVKIMPYDEETLRVFSLKKMNFKDMTGTQKTTFVVLLVFLGLFFVLMVLPGLSKMLGGPNIGNLHFFGNNEKEEEKEEENEFALEGDYITLGNNTYINVEGVKFYNFTKGNNYQLAYNYMPSKTIEDVKALKIYVEFYTHTKTLISRYAFSTETNTLTEGVQGLSQVKMTSNNFNKAFYVRVLVITDAVMEELPETDPGISDPNDPTAGGTGGGTGTGSGTGAGGGTGTGGSSPANPDKSKLMICSKWSMDGSLKINESMNVNIKDDKVVSYDVKYVISSMINNGVPKNYSTYYKKMLTKFKNVTKSYVYIADIQDAGTTATLTYTVVLKDYTFVGIPEEDFKYMSKKELEAYKKTLPPYELEIKKDSTRADAKKQLEAVEWDCD